MGRHFRSVRAALVAGVLVMSVLVGFLTAQPSGVQAATPDEIQNYLQGEPFLSGMARQVARARGVPGWDLAGYADVLAEVTQAKMAYDHAWGWQFRVEHDRAPVLADWRASYCWRANHFAEQVHATKPEMCREPKASVPEFFDANAFYFRNGCFYYADGRRACF